jgi:hypothetical protein
MKKLLRKQDGYFTVEATLVFSAILFIIFAILYAFLLMYENIVILNAANFAAQESAYIISSYPSSEPDLYAIIERELGKGIFPVDDVKKEVEWDKNMLFPSYVKVTVTKKIPIPLTWFANKSFVTLSATSNASICDRPEYIRNINVIKEAGKRAISTISDFGFGVFEKLLSGQ